MSLKIKVYSDYQTNLKTFCQANGLDPECRWYKKAIAALGLTSCL